MFQRNKSVFVRSGERRGHRISIFAYHTPNKGILKQINQNSNFISKEPNKHNEFDNISVEILCDV